MYPVLYEPNGLPTALALRPRGAFIAADNGPCIQEKKEFFGKEMPGAALEDLTAPCHYNYKFSKFSIIRNLEIGHLASDI